MNNQEVKHHEACCIGSDHKTNCPDNPCECQKPKQVKHTPGPWNIDTPEIEAEENLCIARYRVYDPQRAAVIAMVSGIDHADFNLEQSTEEAKANANLIATAPELLEELEQFVADYTFNRTRPNIDKAKLLITKAKGG